jgi:hypothetical protein
MVRAFLEKPKLFFAMGARKWRFADQIRSWREADKL